MRSWQAVGLGEKASRGNIVIVHLSEQSTWFKSQQGTSPAYLCERQNSSLAVVIMFRTSR